MGERAIDRRTDTRIEAHTKLDIVDRSGPRQIELRDLSQGGACLFVAGSHPLAGDDIEVLIPTDGEAVAVQATVVRTTILEDGWLVGVRFRERDASSLAAVDHMIGVLLVGTGGGRRSHPRIAHRLEVRCESHDDLVAILENISMGGLAMNVSAAVEVGEQLLVVLPGEDGEDLLTLPCRVANQREVVGTDPPQYMLGLSFEELSAQRRAMLDAMLIDILGKL